MTSFTFNSLPLAEPIQRAIAEKGYTTPSPIQEKAIPVLLRGGDLLACAQTGTGKTAAFALPILNRFAAENRLPEKREVRTLVLTPTRELAAQVAESFEVYGQYIPVTVSQIYGGVSQIPQVKRLNRGMDVLVATPGRLIDLIEQGHVNLAKIKTFVLDEADRMLDMGFIRDIRRIAANLPKVRQTLFFSATMAPEIAQLAASLLHNPEEIRIAPQGTTAERVDQHVLFVDQKDKQALLVDLLSERETTNAGELSLIFSRTKHGARKLAEKLNRSGIKADAIHGNKSQSARLKTLDQFRNGELPVLVATDVAARGIDVKNITLVINYDLPMEADSYVHRIGRTARAGESGRALSFCSMEDIALLRSIEKLIRQPVPTFATHNFHAESIASGHRSTRKFTRPNPQADARAHRRAEGGGGQGRRQGGQRSGPGRPQAGKLGGTGKPSGTQFNRFQRRRKASSV